MELEELKSLINHKLATEHTDRSAADIAGLLERKTTSVVDKLKRSLWIEIYCCIFAIVLFGYFAIKGEYASLRLYFGLFTLVTMGFLGIVSRLLQRTRQLSASALPVKTNLQTIVHIIEQFSRRYFQFSMAMIPICFLFALVLGYGEHEHVDYPALNKLVRFYREAGWRLISTVLVYIIVLSVGIYYFTKWYLYKLYGRYTEQLKTCIRELGED